VGEAEEVEGPGPDGVAPIAAPEVDEPRLVRMQYEPVLAQSLGQYSEDASRVVFPRESHDEVVRIADEPCAPLKAR
jgi:hypothetical protein